MPLFNSMGILKLMPNAEGPAPSFFTNYFDTLSTNRAEVGKFSSTGSSVVLGLDDEGIGGGGRGLVITTDQYGNFTKQITLLAATGNSCATFDAVYDPVNTLYVTGQYSLVGFPVSNRSMVMKFDNALNILWQKQLYESNGRGVSTTTIAYNTSNNRIYVGGSYNKPGIVPLLASYDSSGNLLFQKQISSTSTRLIGVQFDSNNNYYCASMSQVSNFGMEVSKWNSSDVFQWAVRINTPVAVSVANSVCDSNGNTYLLFYVPYGGSFSETYVVKINTSGAIVWQRVFSNTFEDVAGMAVDDVGNIYVSMFANLTVYVLKIDTNGNIVWQNYLTDPNSGIRAGDFVNNLDWRGNTLWIGAIDFPSGNSYNWSLPDDGTLTGTYTNFTYLPSSLTLTSSTLTRTTLVNTSSNTDLIDANATLIPSVGTFTQTLQPL